MLPAWIEKILEGMGIAGAIIFVQFAANVGLIAFCRYLLVQANKVYGFRLAERDALINAMNNTSKVLADMLKVTEERNELTEEQARLIEKQSQAFELLKVTILAQYDSIRDHNNASAMAVAAMADAIRQLSHMVVENRHIATGHVQAVNAAIGELSVNLRGAIQSASQSQITEMRNLLGHVTVVARKRKVTK